MPFSYSRCTKPVGGIIARPGMNHHCNADDLQIYVTVDRDESNVAALAKVDVCVAELAAWLTNNSLKLNMEKSEVISFPQQRNATACLILKCFRDCILGIFYAFLFSVVFLCIATFIVHYISILLLLLKDKSMSLLKLCK